MYVLDLTDYMQEISRGLGRAFRKFDTSRYYFPFKNSNNYQRVSTSSCLSMTNKVVNLCTDIHSRLSL